MFDALHKNGLILLIFLTAAVYLAALQTGFVFDDRFLIVDNQLLRNDLSTLLLSDLWAGEPHPTNKSNFYRPLFLLSIWIDHQVVGLKPWFFHLQSLCWHLSVVSLTYFFVRLHLSHSLGLLAAFVAALHPLQSEVAIWISARNDSIAAFFCLAALILLTSKSSNQIKRVLGALCCCLAVLSKETALLLPLWVFLFSTDNKKSSFGFAALGLLTGLAIRWQADVGVAFPGLGQWMMLLGYLPDALSQQMSSFVVPAPLSAARRLEYLTPSFWVYGMAILVLLGLIWGFLKSSRFAKAAFILAVTAWLPSWFGVVNTGSYGDRYLYLTVVGLGMASAEWLSLLRVRSRVWFIFTISLIWLGVIQIRLGDWFDDHSFWSASHRDFSNPYTAVSLAYIEYNLAGASPLNSPERISRQEHALQLFSQAYAAEKPYVRGCDIYAQLLLERRGATETLLAAEWMMNNGCPLIKGDDTSSDQNGLLAGVMAKAMVVNGEWERLRLFLATSPRDLSLRDRPILAALAHLDQDLEAYDGHRSAWLNSNRQLTHFDAQVKHILDLYESRLAE